MGVDRVGLPDANERISLSQVVRDNLDAHIDRYNAWRAEHRQEHDKMDEKINEFEKLVPAIRATIWVGALLGVSIVGLIWSLVTGQVQLIFR